MQTNSTIVTALAALGTAAWCVVAEPGPEDYRVILNRLSLIEKITPHFDSFMLPHLREVKEDLLNLAENIEGKGNPVR